MASLLTKIACIEINVGNNFFTSTSYDETIKKLKDVLMLNSQSNRQDLFKAYLDIVQIEQAKMAFR
ncbi:Uncharacterized protein PRO82_002073 [Candidatus Protochlamydia amoebophila]|nr:Uncharacterized protein [Candidatus Protochlamydia amoebophila]